MIAIRLADSTEPPSFKPLNIVIVMNEEGLQKALFRIKEMVELDFSDTILLDDWYEEANNVQHRWFPIWIDPSDPNQRDLVLDIILAAQDAEIK